MRYPHDHENDIIYFGKTNFRNQMKKFGIKTDDRRRHAYVIGKTGMGKTTLLENMILSDIYAGHGACYVDPHGDTAEKLLDYIPTWRINDVVYFNPADVQYPVGFNILESVDDEMKHLVAAGMMGVFKKIWENVWSARMEYILNNTILALLDNPGSTLLGINRVLSDKDYRKEIVANVQDPIVRQFWVKEFAQYQDKFATEAVAPIQNKVGQFLSASVIRNIVAQAKSTINIRKIMDEERILIINLSKGRIGEDASRLLGGMIITKIQMSAMERVDIPEADRRDFYLYVDEFQNFAVESFASILSEARKYRLNLIMAHQYIAQLTEEVRDAVFGNVGTIISFRVGSPDAVFMEDEFMPRFTPEDIINLPKFSIYLKLMIDGVTSQPFSAYTLAPIAHKTGSEQKVIEQSRERYAIAREKIEEHVVRWSGFGGDDIDMGKEFDSALKEAKEKRKEKYKHLYNCTRCKKEFGLPVELDRARPIYCDDCMPIVKEERAKGKGGGGGNKRGGERKPEPRKNEPRKDEPRSQAPRPPKIREGELVVEQPAKQTASLSELRKEDRRDKQPQPMAEAKPDPTFNQIEKNEPAPKPATPQFQAKDILNAEIEQEAPVELVKETQIINEAVQTAKEETVTQEIEQVAASQEEKPASDTLPEVEQKVASQEEKPTPQQVEQKPAPREERPAPAPRQHQQSKPEPEVVQGEEKKRKRKRRKRKKRGDGTEQPSQTASLAQLPDRSTNTRTKAPEEKKERFTEWQKKTKQEPEKKQQEQPAPQQPKPQAQKAGSVFPGQVVTFEE